MALSPETQKQLDDWNNAPKTEKVQRYLAEQWLLAAEYRAEYFEWYLNATQFYKEVLAGAPIQS